MLLVSCQTLPACSNRVLFSSPGYPGFQAATYASRSYTGIAPGYTYQFPGEWSCLLCFLVCLQVMGAPGMIYNPGSAPFTLSCVWSLNWRWMWKGDYRSPGIGGNSLSFIRIILTLQ